MNEKLLTAAVANGPDEGDLSIAFELNATTSEITIALAAIIREIWRSLDADDPEAGDWFRENLAKAMESPEFFTQKGGAAS